MQVKFNADSDFDNETLAKAVAPFVGYNVDVVTVFDEQPTTIRLDEVDGFGVKGSVLGADGKPNGYGVAPFDWAEIDTIIVN